MGFKGRVRGLVKGLEVVGGVSWQSKHIDVVFLHGNEEVTVKCVGGVPIQHNQVLLVQHTPAMQIIDKDYSILCK